MSRSTFSKREIMFLNSLPNFNVPGVVNIKFFWYTELSIYIQAIIPLN